MKQQKLMAFLTTACASALLLTGCFGEEIVDSTPVLQAQPLAKQDLMNYISVSGNVTGSNTVHVTTELMGAKVKALHVELGSAVSEGDVLCEFDTEELQKRYDELQKNASRTENAKAKAHQKSLRALSDAKAEKSSMLSKAQKGIDRAVSSRDSVQNQISDLKAQLQELGNVLSAAEASGDVDAYNEAAAAYNALGDQISELNATLPELNDAVAEAREAYDSTARSCDDAIESAQEMLDAETEENDDDTITKQLEELQEQIDSAVVKAPRSGVITALNLAEGGVAEGVNLMTIEDTDTLRINVVIAETDILSIHEGQDAIIFTNATGDTEFHGKVSRVVNIFNANESYYGELTGGSYTAEITIDKSEKPLLIGMTAKAKIILDEIKDVYAVPYDAIVEKDDDEKCVYVAKEASDGKYSLHSVPVTVGMETNYYTQIDSSELKEGDMIVSAAMDINDGDLVFIDEGYNDYLDEHSMKDDL